MLLLVATGFAGCASAPPTLFVAAQVHPALATKVRVITDACVQRRVLLGANHFVVEASQAAAKAVDDNVRAHLLRRDVIAQGAPAVSVCGVLNDPQNPQKTFAQVADGPTRQQPPPLALSAPLGALGDRVRGLPPLLAELQLAAQRTAAADAKAQPEAATLSPQARELAAAIAAPDDMLLYVGLSGNSESAGKIAAQLTAIVGLSVVVAIAAAPAGAAALAGPTAAQAAATQAASMVGVSFISIDGMLLAGALVDTRSGRIVWTNAVLAPSDPMKPESLGRGLTTDRLLATLLNQPTAQWSPPGRPAALVKAAP